MSQSLVNMKMIPGMLEGHAEVVSKQIQAQLNRMGQKVLINVIAPHSPFLQLLSPASSIVVSHTQVLFLSPVKPPTEATGL